MYPGEIAQSTPNKPAVIMSDTGESLSFLELHHYAERMANLFQASGLKPVTMWPYVLRTEWSFCPFVGALIMQASITLL